MNSSACGFRFAILIFGTVEIAASRSSNGMIRLATFFGAGTIFRVSSVMTPRVPSLPIIRSIRLYPELVLLTLEPK